MRPDEQGEDYSTAMATAASTVKAKPAIVTWMLHPVPVGLTVWYARDRDGLPVLLVGKPVPLGEANVEVSFWTKT